MATLETEKENKKQHSKKSKEQSGVEAAKKETSAQQQVHHEKGDASHNVEFEQPRLRKKYISEVIPALFEQFKYRNSMQIPKLEKIVINMGLGEAISNPKIIESAAEELTAITGQKAIVTRAKKSIAAFKLRAGTPIGVMVTLRRERMWEFLDRLFTLAIPRTRDFRGVSRKGFDGRGNYSLGLKEQIIFPEINYARIDKIKGLNISFVTTAKSNEEGLAFLKCLGVPFRAA